MFSSILQRNKIFTMTERKKYLNVLSCHNVHLSIVEGSIDKVIIKTQHEGCFAMNTDEINLFHIICLIIINIDVIHVIPNKT